MQRQGFILAEVIIGICLLIIFMVGIFGAFQFAIKVSGQSKARISALALANHQIEQIRNLPYQDIGTLGGIPPGDLAQEVSLTANNVDFVLKNIVLYIDDPFDDLAPIDPLPTDYKQIRVKVAWQNFFGGEVSLVTNISPKGVETEEGGGTLKVSVFDAGGLGVADANVNIINEGVVPSINVDYQTNINGDLIIAGVPASLGGYQISVSKGNFSSDRTYGQEEIANPLKPHVSVFAGAVTEISFSIDQVSSFAVETRAQESFSDDFGNWSKISDSSQVDITGNQVFLADSGSGYFNSGWLESEPINPSFLLNWDRFSFNDGEPDDTDLRYQILYATGTQFELVPESDLNGNSAGFDFSSIDISDLDILKYSGLKLRANFTTSDILDSPVLDSWLLTYNTPLISTVDFQIKGSKILGTQSGGEPVYKYSNWFTTSGGLRTIAGLEWDSYTFSATGSAPLDLINTASSPQPINLLPNSSESVRLFYSAENTLKVIAVDSSSSDPIFGAGIRLSNSGLGYNDVQPTDQRGQAFFIPLENDLYTIETIALGYQDSTTTINVLGDVFKIIHLDSF